jgi:hypothetical protein
VVGGFPLGDRRGQVVDAHRRAGRRTVARQILYPPVRRHRHLHGIILTRGYDKNSRRPYLLLIE